MDEIKKQKLIEYWSLLPFYIQARYPDAKKDLIKQTNKDFSLDLINKGRDFKLWISSKLKQ